MDKLNILNANKITYIKWKEENLRGKEMKKE